MRFGLSENELSCRDEIQLFVRNEVTPSAHERDIQDIYPTEIIKSMARKGYTTLTVPTRYNGLGKSKLDACILMEEVAYGCAATAISLITIFQAETMLLLYGNEKAKDVFLPKFRDGLISSYALTESGRGSDIRHLDTKAVRKGNQWVINGRKTFITSGSAAEFFIILAETEVGVSVFAVERDVLGVRTEMGELSETFGLRNGPHVDVVLEDVVVEDYQLIGIEGKGLKQAVTTLNNSRTIAAAISIGIARAAYDYSLDWVNQRSAFDQKVFEFQGIQWMFAHMLTNINAARLLTYRAATLLDQEGQSAISEASQAKLFAGTMATKVCEDAVQVCGAFGTTINAPLGRFLRDAKAYEIAGGSNEILRNTIAKEIGKAMPS
ncbi:acyl-CoA dehydrogenase family protein [Alicyclobacillus tolerans]|uniref:acyl-CoA dehydrogenase family protein n=1 Tax=Alicyclobacillus tolerans TaxID=90970 RepID=UPI001F34438E|nr:acyl-CoA dehydrogenase family protein [Alicyclobacillus tolerans]MCF8567913.1 acyl-CoA dehydrogenase family protein [Alicyclobacillus tolerans]